MKPDEHASPLLEIVGASCESAGFAPFRSASLTFPRSTFNLLAGGDESGGTLLLRVLGLLQPPDSGDVLLHGKMTAGLPEDERTDLRNIHFGYVFAAPFLLPAFTAMENVAMPLFRISHLDPAEARARTGELLEFAGVADLAQEMTHLLDIRDQLRVSLARALANRPEILIVENLSRLIAGQELRDFAALLRQAVAQFGTCIIAATDSHFPTMRGDRVIELVDGIVQRDARLVGEFDA